MKTQKKVLIVMLSVTLMNPNIMSGQDVLSSSEEYKQELNDQIEVVNDHLFPSKGRSAIGFITSIPLKKLPIAVVEFTHGVSNRFSIGLIGGTTGVLALYGVRINALLLQREKFRMYFRMPIIYYPERKGTFLFDKEHKEVEPWMLSSSAVNAEWETEKGLKWSLGIGIVETFCFSIKGIFKKEIDIHETPTMLRVFNTFGGSVSIPFCEKWMFQLEIIAAMNGLKLSQKNDFPSGGGSPINPLFTISYSL